MEHLLSAGSCAGCQGHSCGPNTVTTSTRMELQVQGRRWMSKPGAIGSMMELHRQVWEPGRGLRRRNQGGFLEEVMLKLRPEGWAGHVPGRPLYWGQQRQVQRPQMGGSSKECSSVKAKCDTPQGRGGHRASSHRPRTQAESFKEAQAPLTPNSTETSPCLPLSRINTRGPGIRKM